MATREKYAITSEEKAEQKRAIMSVRAINDESLKRGNPPKKAFIETYGCQQNVSDSEVLMGMLIDMGYEKTLCKEDADIIIYNTCAVRENAELKVFGNLGALKHLKTKNPSLIIGVCGCMIQQQENSETVRKKHRHVDLVFGTHSLYFFPSILEKCIKESQRVIDHRETDGYLTEGYAPKRAQGPCASVSVMYGCNNFCSYCIVPYVRGRERSRNLEDILSEIKSLSREGYKEVMLLGQNVNSYGKDLDEGFDFADLLTRVCEIDGIERVRFMTSHPKDISDKLIDTMAREEKVCNQLHLPVQAGNNRVLKSMNRCYTKEGYLEIVRKVKEKIPSVTLTTDIIVGFPGETTEEFEDTIDVLEKVRYDTIFSFIYSKRPNTPASKMEDVISKEEKKKNFDRLLEVQDRISLEKNKALEGKVVRVLVEGESKNDKTCLSGRTEGGKIVNFKTDIDLTGKFADIKITEAKTWSLWGEIQN